MSHLTPERRARAERLIELYPRRRSALIPLCHLAQEQDGHLTEPAMAEIAELVGVTPAEVRGTATFYDMLHTEPVGRYVVSVCTNIACMLAGAEDLLDHAQEVLDVGIGGTTEDGLFTLEEAECLADCNIAPCVQVNHRYARTTSPAALDELLEDLRAGRRAAEIPPHGTLVRVMREPGIEADPEQVASERSRVRAEQAARAPESAS